VNKKLHIIILSVLVILGSALSFSPAFASELGEAITGYLKSPETYNPSNIQAKVAERTNFCSCVMSSGPALFDGCTAIHPVLPNLPQSFIRNRLLNEMLVSSTSNSKTAAQIAVDLQSKLTSCPNFTSQFTVTNSSYSIGDPSSYVDVGSGRAAGAANFCQGMAPDDTHFSEQWGLCETQDATGHPSNIKAANAWYTTEGDDQIVVAVIDTGVDYTHEDLSGNIWVNDDPIGDIADACDRVLNPSIALADDDCNGKVDDVRGWDFAEGDNTPMDTHGHGTEMAGVIASVMNNSMGVAGVCPNCKIMPLRVAIPDGSVDDFSAARVAAAVGYAIKEGADVINMSFFKRYSTGNPDPYGEASPQLRSAYEDGIVLVASAGNYADPSAPVTTVRKLAYPAAFGFPGSANTNFDVVAVAATDDNNERAAGFDCPGDSNPSDGCTTIFGPWIDISAPGLNIVSTVPPNISTFQDTNKPGYVAPGYFKASGSSHASAHVAGVAALIKSMNPDVNQDLTNIFSDCYFPGNIVITNRCGPNLDQPCFHDYVRELMKVTASCFAAKPYAAAEFADFGAGLVNADYAVDSMALPVGNGSTIFGPLPTDPDPYFDYNDIFMCGHLQYDGDTTVLRAGDIFSFQFNATNTNGHDFGVCLDDLFMPILDPIGTINGENTRCSGYLGMGGWLNFPSNGPGPFTYTWQPTAEMLSSGQREFNFRFVAIDETLSATVSDVFKIVVNALPEFVNAPATATGTVGGASIAFTLDTTDDGDTVNVNMTNSLPGASFDSSTHTFTMNPTQQGAFAAGFTALDGCEGYSHYPNPNNPETAAHSVAIVVNGPPAVTITSPSSSCTTTRRPSLQATVSDVDGLLNYAVRLYSTSTNSLIYSLPITSLNPSATSIPSYTPPADLSYAGYRYELDVRDMNNNLTTRTKSFSVATSCGGSGTGCFLPGTPITMADGSMKSIESIVIGDQVAAFDEKTGEMATDTVSQVFIHNDIHTGYIEINDMKVTGEHPLWIKDKGWTKAGEVKVGDILLRQDNTDELVTHIKPVDGKYTVHNLETQPHHTYYAQGKRVHNKGGAVMRMMAGSNEPPTA